MLKHNEDTYRELIGYTSRNKNCCVVNPCGSGKTSIMARFVKDNKSKSIIVISHQGNAEGYFNSRDSVFNTTKIYTYSKLHSIVKSDKIDSLKADIYIFDEAHYMGAKLWSKDIDLLISKFNPLVVGFTATPQRFEHQGTDYTIVDEYFSGNSAGNFTSRKLQRLDVFQEPEYVLSFFDIQSILEEYREKLEESSLSNKSKESYSNKLDYLERYWSDVASPEKVLKDKLPRYMYKESCNRIVVYTKDIKESNLWENKITSIISSIFPDKKVESYVYNSQTNEGVLKSFLEDDSCYIKIIYAVNKFSETFHLDDLYVSIMLRPSSSNILITQQFGRINTIGSDKKPIIFDFVNNLYVLNSIIHDNSKVLNKEKRSNSGSDFRLDLRFVNEFCRVFKALDDNIKSIKYFEYNGFRGTLKDIARINFCNAGRLESLVLKGVSIEGAIKKSRWKEINYMVFKRFDSDIKLTDYQRDLVERYMPAVDRFAERRGITDEDIISELYLEEIRIISKFDGNSSANPYTALMNAVRNRYIYILRYRTFLSLTVSSYEDLDGEYYDDIDFALCRSDIRKSLDSLYGRDREFAELYFGFNGNEPLIEKQIANKWGISYSRVNQIKCRLLRKFRKPSLLKSFKGISNESYIKINN